MTVRDRDKDRDREIKRQRQRRRQTETETERGRDRDTETETQRVMHFDLGLMMHKRMHRPLCVRACQPVFVCLFLSVCLHARTLTQ